MMRLPQFRYHAPGTMAEAARLLAEMGPEAMLLAGGTDLLPNMKRRQQSPREIIGLRRIAVTFISKALPIRASALPMRSNGAWCVLMHWRLPSSATARSSLFRLIARRVEYDLETASKKILEAGLPEVLARRLAIGQ